MPQSLAKVYLHIVFSTKNREKFIAHSIEKQLWKYMGGICKGMGCNPVKIGGYCDHVHVLCMFSRKLTIADLVQQLKQESSKWIKKQDSQFQDFYWQAGYGVFSVNENAVDSVAGYIQNQFQHHQNRSFKEEILTFLQENEIEFDDRYVWD